MYLRRKVDAFLEEWIADPARKPLIIKGSRQIGKTESILHFAAAHYESIIEINFVRDVKYKNIIADGYETSNIIKNISLLDPSRRFIPGKTLIFFDEITEFPEIAASLKFFCIDKRFDVICSGSMLGINYKRIESNSVGYKKDYDMFSMDFEEFLWAKGYENDTVESLLSHMSRLIPFSDLEMQVYHSLFLDYSILGGMPAVVAEYIERGSFEGSLDTQKQLIADYKEDIRKYATGVDQTRIINVFNRVAPQLARENKKFQISKVAQGARFRDYRGCAEWLADAGMVNICYCMEFPELPLGGNYEPDIFKLYFSDTGLLVSMLDDEAQEDLRANKNLGVYKGALYENMVGEAFVKQGYKLFYYKREDSTLEADFFIRSAASLVPVEVKAKNGKAKSMKTLISSNRYSDIRYGIKLSINNIGHKKVYERFSCGGRSMSKVILLNGSPHAHGCTATALLEMIKVFEAEGIETELVQVGTKNIRGCIACGTCEKNGKCVFDDLVNEVAPKFEAADGLVIGSPVYYGSPNGNLLSFLDRLFYSTSFSKHMKVGASVVSCRRGGNTASFDVLNKYFTISSMPVASSTYWNQVHGFTAEDVKKDLEGLQTMRNLARNMSFMIKAFADAKEKYGYPELETGVFTSFPDGK